MLQRLLYTLTLIIALTFAPCLAIETSASVDITDIDQQTVKIEQRGTTLIISGANGKTVNVMDLTGQRVLSVRIDQSEKRVELPQNRRAIYIVKVGNVAKKIQVNYK